MLARAREVTLMEQVPCLAHTHSFVCHEWRSSCKSRQNQCMSVFNFAQRAQYAALDVSTLPRARHCHKITNMCARVRAAVAAVAVARYDWQQTSFGTRTHTRRRPLENLCAQNVARRSCNSTRVIANAHNSSSLCKLHSPVTRACACVRACLCARAMQ